MAVKKKPQWKVNKIKYDTKYVRETYKRYEIRLRMVDDSAIIEFLDTKENKNDYIKSLIEDDMNKSGG